MKQPVTDLDQEIEQVRQHLYSLYKARREIRESLKPKRKILSGEEVFARASNGEPLEAIAEEFGISLRLAKDKLYYAISGLAFDKTRHLGNDWEKTWKLRYIEQIKINASLPEGARLSNRRFWPWSATTHGGIAWNDLWTTGHPTGEERS